MAKKKDYSKLANQIIENVGGKENIESVIHCITRLRFYLKDENLANTQIIKDLEGVIDVKISGGQYQVVIGQEVENVFKAVQTQLGEETTTTSATKNEGKGNWFSELLGVITGSMSPIIHIIAAAGIIKGVLAILVLSNLITDKSMIYTTISAMADAAFFFLPVLVGFAAAKRLGGDPMITATVGAFLTYPSMIAYGEKGATMFSLFGVHFDFVKYTYSIFPMIVAAWLVKVIANFLREKLPSAIRSIFTPMITIFVVATITLVITGPIIQGVATGLAVIITKIVSMSGWLGGLLIGGFYQLLVIFGLHWGVVPLIVQQLSSTGESPLNAIVSVTMVSQGAAVLAVAMKSKKAELREMGYAGAISAFCGVTEPAIYGINLRFKKVFVSGLIGSAVGGFITGLFGGSMFGLTGSLIGFPSFFNLSNKGDLSDFYIFLVSSIAAIVVSFVVTWVWGYNDNMVMGDKVEKKAQPSKK